MAYGLLLYKELTTPYGTQRIEIYKDGFSGTATEMAGLHKDGIAVSKDSGNLTQPITTSVLTIRLSDCEEIDYSQFFTPNATLFKVVWQTRLTTSWETRWTGFITPDSFAENLAYRDTLTLTARDNLGRLNDYDFDLAKSQMLSVRAILNAAMAKAGVAMGLTYTTTKVAASPATTLAVDGLVNTSLLQGMTWGAAVELLLTGLGLTLAWNDGNAFEVRDISQAPASTQGAFFINKSGFRQIRPAWKNMTVEQDYGLRQNFYDGQFSKGDVGGTGPSYKTFTIPSGSLWSGNLTLLNPYNGAPTPYETLFLPVGNADTTDDKITYSQHVPSLNRAVTLSFNVSNSTWKVNNLGNAIWAQKTIQTGSSQGQPVKNEYGLRWRLNVFLTVGSTKYILRETWVPFDISDMDLWLHPYLFFSLPGTGEGVNMDQEVTIYIGELPGAGTLEVEFYKPLAYVISDDGQQDCISFSNPNDYGRITDLALTVDEGIDGRAKLISINAAHNMQGQLSAAVGQVPAGRGNALTYLGGLFYNDADNTPLTDFARAQNGASYDLLELVAREYISYQNAAYDALSGTMMGPAAFRFDKGITFGDNDYRIVGASLAILSNTLSAQVLQQEAAFDTTAYTIETVDSEGHYGRTGGGSIGQGFQPGGGGSDRFFEAIPGSGSGSGEIAGAKALYDLYIIQGEGSGSGSGEVTKNVTEILKHLALQVINPGESNEETVLVSDIAFASLYSITAGGIGQGGGESGGSLAGLADVTLDEPAEGDILRYDETTSHWINTPLEVALSGLTDVAIATAPANGQVLMWDAEAHKWKPGSASGQAAGTLADLTDVAIGTQTDGQALVWSSSLGKWVPGAGGGGGTTWKIYTGACTTAAATTAKTATTETFPVDGEGHPQVGTFVWIKFSKTNTASSPTLNVNSTGAYRIYYNASQISTSNLNKAGYANRYTGYMFNGTDWCFWSQGSDDNSTYTNKSLGQGYGTCATAAATTAKVVTMSDYVLSTGGIVSVLFDEDVPAGATMNINSKGAKAIYYQGAAITDGVIKAGDLATFIYSTYYRLISIDRDFDDTPAPTPINNLFAQIVDGTTQEVTGIEALYDLWIIQDEGSSSGSGDDTLKNVTEILRHLSLQTVDNATVLVSDISFASLGSIVAGGTSTSGGSTGGSLATLSDVALSGTLGGDTLVYNGTTSHWENMPLALTSLADVAIGSPAAGQVLMWDAGLGKWRPGTVSGGGGGGGGGIGSISLTMPTGFSVSGSPLTADGTLAVSFASGYSLPLTNDVAKGVAAYGWGNHAAAGYLSQDTADGRYGAGLGMYNNRIYLFNKNGSNIGDYITAGNLKEMLVGSSSATLVTTSDLSGYATQSWVSSNFLESSDLDGYATQSWVNGKGYLTSSALDGYATEQWVTNKGYLTSSSLSGYATQTWVGQQGYLTSAVTSLNSLTGSVTLGQGSNISITKSGSTITIANTYSYSHPTGGANVTISAATGKVLSAITVNNLGHVTSVSSKTLAKGDIPSLDYLPISGGTLTGSLTVQGNVTATGNVVAGSASDRRLKKDIRTISLTEASDLLSVLNPVVFQWNEKAGELGGLSGVSRGFLADEYLDILPNAGRKIWGVYDAIDYNQVIPYLVAGWQQQNLRIRILEGEIADLKYNNELLRRRLKESNVIQ